VNHQATLPAGETRTAILACWVQPSTLKMYGGDPAHIPPALLTHSAADLSKYGSIKVGEGVASSVLFTAEQMAGRAALTAEARREYLRRELAALEGSAA